MKIIVDQAENELLKTLSWMRSGEQSRSCLHIKGAVVFGDDMRGLEPFLVYWIGHHDESLTFICHDKDIFIFAPHVTAALFDKLRSRFQDYTKIHVDDQTGLLAFYDTHLNGLGLTELVVGKSERQRDLQKDDEEKQKQYDKQIIRESIINQSFDEKFLQTIDQRRHQRNNICILLVEDDMFSRKLVGNVLKEEFSLSYAENGQDALMRYVMDAPDIVFLDIGLPDITGHDVLEKILSLDSKAFIVMLSGNGYVDNIKRAIASGAKGFVGKPFSKDKLLHYINLCSTSQSG